MSTLINALKPAKLTAEHKRKVRLDNLYRMESKSLTLAFILAFLLGPIGVMYARLGTGLIMLVVSLVLVFRIPVAGTLLAWILNMLFSVTTAASRNRFLKLKYQQ